MADAQRPAVKHLVAAGLAGFVVGAFVVGTLGNLATARDQHSKTLASDLVDDTGSPIVEAPAATTGHGDGSNEASVRDLAERDLDIPVQGITADHLVRSFHDARGGNREHEAMDILAPRNTPVIAVEDGTIARLFLSKAGGNTIYQFDPGREYCYYYAHLERYAAGLKEGDRVTRGQVIGYVGTSGNAPKNTPHLHFAVFRLTADKHWWEGTPLDPFDILR